MSYQGSSEQYLGNAGGSATQMVNIGNTMLGIAQKTKRNFADQAAVDSNASFDESLGTQNRNLTRMGINPNSGRYAGLQQKWALSRAAAEAGAKTRGRAQSDQLNMNYLNQAGGMFGSAVNANRAVSGDYGQLASDQMQALMGDGGNNGWTINVKGAKTGRRTIEDSFPAQQQNNNNGFAIGRNAAIDTAEESGGYDFFGNSAGQQYGAISGIPGLGYASAMEPMMDTGALNSNVVAGFANGGPGVPMSEEGRMSALGNEDTMPMGGETDTGKDFGFGALSAVGLMNDLWGDGDGGGGLPGLDIGNSYGSGGYGIDTSDQNQRGEAITDEDLWAGRQRQLKRSNSALNNS